MKSISSSIIVLAGAATFVAGTFHSHSQTQLVVCPGGLVLGVIGLVGWLVALVKKD
jgi:hypothetical protein